MAAAKILTIQKPQYVKALLHHYLAKLFAGKPDRPIDAKAPVINHALILYPDHLGDHLQSSTALWRLRDAYPGASLVFAGRLVPDDAFLRKSLPYDTILGLSPDQLDQGVKDYIDHYRPDAIIYLRGRGDHTGIMWHAQRAAVPVRAGGGEKGQGALLTHPYYPQQWQAVTVYQNAILDQLLGVSTQAPATPVWPDGRLPQPKHIAKILISPFSQHVFRWPMQHWDRLLDMLKPLGMSIAVVGSGKNYEEAEKWLERHPTVSNLCGKTTLEELFAAMRAARLHITLCTGTRHVAVATGTPSVAIGHGSDAEEVIGKYSATETYLRASVPCSPCGYSSCPYGHYHCLTQTTPEYVFGQVKARLLEV